MKIAVVSYSLTGNNDALGASVAKELSAEHIKITETKQRTTVSIVLDMIFNRTPRVQPMPAALAKYERILFVGPVWMGRSASPFRAYFRYLKAHPKPYAFASISGGALNTNPKLADDLKKRAGTAPAAFVDLHIADLLPPDPKPTTKDTSAYRLNGDDITNLTGIVVHAVRDVMIPEPSP